MRLVKLGAAPPSPTSPTNSPEEGAVHILRHTAYFSPHTAPAPGGKSPDTWPMWGQNGSKHKSHHMAQVKMGPIKRATTWTRSKWVQTKEPLHGQGQNGPKQKNPLMAQVKMGPNIRATTWLRSKWAQTKEPPHGPGQNGPKHKSHHMAQVKMGPNIRATTWPR